MGQLIDLEGLKRLSRRCGREPTLVQGAGGNTSIKDGSKLYVKASGFWLADACDKDMFVCVDLDRLRNSIKDNASRIALDSYVIDGRDPPLKPSIETTMHAVLAHRIVIHTHSVNAIAVAVRRDAEAVLGEKLAGLKWAWVPYARPGLPLTRKILDVISSAPDILVLGNHGVVIGADDCESADALIGEVESRLAAPLRRGRAGDVAALLALAEGTGYGPSQCDEGHEIATDADSLTIAVQGSLYPDHVVFLGPGAVVLPQGVAMGEWLSARRGKGREDPAMVLVEDVGLLVRGNLASGGVAMVHCLALVLQRIQASATINYLSPEEEQDLLGWDAETYRQSLSR